jgi:hypothetical protein
MRKTLLIAGIALLFLNGKVLKAQTSLNWASSFSPSWSDGSTTGTASNVGGSGINCTATATITGGGSFMQALGGSGAQTPTVSGSTFTVPGTTNRLQVTPNYTSNASYTDIVLTFTSLATNVSFKIVDIDKSNANSTTYFDQVTVTGSNGITTYNATLSKYDAVTDPNFLIISGNIAHVNTTSGQGGNTASDAVDQRGTVNVSFGTTSLTSIKIHYNNTAGADADPASQAIAIGSVSFSASTLPVSLTAFSGHRQLQDVVLDWITQQEINTASFDIERNSGGNWETIGTVTARGNSNSVSNYRFTDINPQGSVLLYRLKQTDIDANYKYSNIIRIATKNSKLDLLSYPNPFTAQVNVSISSPSDQQVAVTLYDEGGKTVRTETKNLYTGSNNFTITGLDKLTRTVYYLEVKDAAGAILDHSKLVKE